MSSLETMNEASGGAPSLQDLFLFAIKWEARGTVSFEFRSADRYPLQLWEVGSHIDLHLPNGLVRSYSIINLPRDRTWYLLGVALAKNSRGGSRYLHDTLRVG
jgi:vanillate O-demethylase ferredoxin subunit